MSRDSKNRTMWVNTREILRSITTSSCTAAAPVRYRSRERSSNIIRTSRDHGPPQAGTAFDSPEILPRPPQAPVPWRCSFELLSKTSKREEVNSCGRVQPLRDRYSMRVGRRRRGPRHAGRRAGGRHEALLVLGGSGRDPEGRQTEARGDSPGARPENDDIAGRPALDLDCRVIARERDPHEEARAKDVRPSLTAACSIGAAEGPSRRPPPPGARPEAWGSGGREGLPDHEANNRRR